MYTYKSENILMISFHTNDSHKRHHVLLLLLCEQTFFVVINQINKHKAKICNHCTYNKIIIKNVYFFSSQCMRMSGNSINFNNKKIKISDFYKDKNKKIFNIDVLMLIKYWSPEKYHMVKIIHSNTLLDIMIMMLLDHYL